MPTLEELEKFKTLINNLGDESRVLRERGESIQDIQPPEPATDADLDLLLADDLFGDDTLPGEAADGISDGFPDESLDDLLFDSETADTALPDIDSFAVEPADAEIADAETADTDMADAETSDEFSQGGVDEMEALLGNFADDMADTDNNDDSGADPFSDDFTLDDIAPADIDNTTEVTDEDPFSLDDLSPLDDDGLDGLDLGTDDVFDAGSEAEPENDISGEAADEPVDLPDTDLPDDLDGFPETEEGLDASDEEFGDLDELLDLGDQEETPDLPDVDQALDNLSQADAENSDAGDELTLDEELNFDDELGADLISDLSDFDDDSQQFSMEDFGDQYNFKEDDADFTSNLGVNLSDLEESLDDAMDDGATQPFAISEEDFVEIRRTLASLPRNLKLAIEEILADERYSGDDLRPLVDSLLSGDSPKTLVSRVKTVANRRIVLPRGYEKQSGSSLAQRRASLGYRLVKEGWPVVRMILLVISITWITSAAVFMWVYRPIKAGMLYDQGLAAISVDEVDRATRYFFDAWDGWPLFVEENDEAERIENAPVIVRGWKQDSRWLEYARALRRRKHWNDAEDFYKGYLAVKPESKDIRLEYSSFLSGVLGKYGPAVQILEEGRRISGKDNDRDYLLGEGDVYLDWADDDASKYEMARIRYAKVLEISRNDERAYLSMMRYQLRLANDEEIDKLLPVFDGEKPGETTVPALAAEVYAGLGEYHLKRNSISEARRFLNLALSADPSAAEPPFVNAAYWRLQGDEERELNSYKLTLVNLEGRESLSRNDLEMRIMSLGGMGRINVQRSQRLRNLNLEASMESGALALNNYLKALNLYEDARERNQLGASAQYGSLYTELGDLYFNGARPSRDLDFSLVPLSEDLSAGADRETELRLAIEYYNEAETLFDRGGSGSNLPAEVLYRRAYANYVLGNRDALVDFYRVARRRPEDYEARLALATSLLQSGDYEASRSQYARTIALLDDELRRTGGELMPFERPGHAELLLRYIACWNNLGVGRARSAARGGGEDDYAAALGAFTTASEYLDMVYSDMDTLIADRGAVALRDTDDRRIWDDTAAGERNDRKEVATNPYQNRLRLLGLSRADTGDADYLVYPDIPASLR